MKFTSLSKRVKIIIKPKSRIHVHLQEVLLSPLLDLHPEDQEPREPALDAVGVVEGLRHDLVLVPWDGQSDESHI